MAALADYCSSARRSSMPIAMSESARRALSQSIKRFSLQHVELLV